MDGVVFKGDDALSMDKAVIFIVEGATEYLKKTIRINNLFYIF